MIELGAGEDARGLHALRRLGARGGAAPAREVRVEVGIGAVVPDAARVDVVLAHHARERAPRSVGGGEDAQVIAGAEVHAVLGVDRGRLRGAVLAEALGLAERERGEGLVVHLPGRDDADDPRLAERAVRGLDLVAPLRDAEVEVGAPHDGRVPLARVVGSLQHAHALDNLGEDEVDVRVALPVDVQGDVDGDPAHLHLDARAVVEVEPAQVDVVAEPLAVLVIDEEARRGGEHLARLLVRGGVEELAIDAHVAEAARGRLGDALHVDRQRARRSRRRDRRRRLRRWRRRGRVEDDDVLDARADGLPVTRGGREPGCLDRSDGRQREGVGRPARRAGGLHRRLDAPARVDHELQHHLRLDGGDARWKRGDDGRERLRLHERRRRRRGEEQRRDQGWQREEADAPGGTGHIRVH